ncbi:class I SAM-dependent methyltransferase [Amycolatopsis rhizosphaerae]|uniref:Class I SAM-dependent methyltransferase n=1 Tax=Amycolatopsis rhizosphaerae TaxID=2053003 RepID=A0A558BQE8_9PSEU|nr:class I SAM-dependent methyltransferase [Amycolatopsis rhizosphaerae]TVT38731.1 class I SAM-dependent methyltransferase [Amycolatopsis rhizosphaerae]
MTTATDPYRLLGRGYADVRRPDPRIARCLYAALGDAATVLNVGAGAGSYEPGDRHVLAVEPSATMLGQRHPGSAPAVRAVAEALPCADDGFDVAVAWLTVHHWRDPAAGLAELRRVSRRQVVLTWDVEIMARYWLVADYLPEIAERERGLATLDAVIDGLTTPGRRVDVQAVDVPWDCTDGFLAAYWRRPHHYLDAAVRAGMSGVASLPDTVVRPALARLADDLRTGAWHRHHRDLSGRDSLDVGYRLVVAS